ncbi:MAG TPA: flagellar hook-length control protein FliK [Bradyrhizobium sp.]|nr:flagellar hook-length control protein FliK [Bradyrhizobium sp.]
MAAAAIIPSATPKTVQPKSAVAVAAKGAASTPDGKSASSGRSATGTDVLAAEPKPEQPAPVKPESGNDNSDRTKSDAAATKASPPIDSAPAHSVLAPTAHPLNDSTDASSQTTTVIQPAVPVAPTTATPAAALSVTAATNGLVPVSGLAFEIAASARSGKSHFDIRLDPADLGRIDVRIDVDRTGQVTSHVTVEKPETLSMLRQDAPQLQRALDDAGFKTGDGGLQFSLRDQSSSGNNWRNETSGNAQRLAITEDESVPATIAGRSYGRMLGSTSGVDIRV